MGLLIYEERGGMEEDFEDYSCVVRRVDDVKWACLPFCLVMLC